MAKEVRLEILQGNEAGAQFRITGERILFGRANSCDVVITDPSVSRNHAELIKVQGSYVLKDLGSSNGIFLNGQKVLEKQVKHGDVFSIGNHSYRYYEMEVSSEKRNVPAKAQGENTRIAQQATASAPSVSVPSFGGANPKKKRMIMYGGIGLLLVLIFSMGGEDKKAENPKDQKKTEDGAEGVKEPADVMLEDTPEYKRTVQEGMEDFYNKANEYYFEGRREYRVKNYVRALDSFKRALTFYPRHAPSREYAVLAQQHIKEDSKNFLALGKKLMAQQKYREAIKLFNDSMDLNSNNQESDVFKEAEKMKRIAEKRLEESMR